MNKKTSEHLTGHLNQHQHHSLLALEQERSEMLDGELELTCGPNGVTALSCQRQPRARNRAASPSACAFRCTRFSPG